MIYFPKCPSFSTIEGYDPSVSGSYPVRIKLRLSGILNEVVHSLFSVDKFRGLEHIL